MKTIKVFLASSDELRDERQKFGNLIRRLDDIYIKRGIHVQLLVWEDMDPCYNNVRKQDEYNSWIRDSDMFVCLFSTRAGQYTLEELYVAQQENIRRQMPKLMIYCRDLQPNEVEMSDLVQFKQRMEKEMGHFWGHYPTTDKLHLDFVMYFMRSTEGRSSALKVENGHVVLDGFTVANMDNLPFAVGNEGYQRMLAEIQELWKEIEETRVKLEKKQQKLEKKKARLEKEPDDDDNQEDYEEAKEEVEDLTSKLQSKQDKYNTIQERLTSLQQALLDTAKRISELKQEKVCSELQRAIDEFELGHVEAANAIIDGMRDQIEQYKEQIKSEHTIGHKYIKALFLQTKTLMADVTIRIEERIDRTLKTYQEADELAQLCLLPKIKHISLLHDYYVFLKDNRMYNHASKIQKREQTMYEELYVCFSSENELVRNMRIELEELSVKIEKIRQRLLLSPRDDSSFDELKAMIKRFNILTNELTENKQYFLSAARKIADMQLDSSSELLKAGDEFIAGHVEIAGEILDRIIDEAFWSLNK